MEENTTKKKRKEKLSHSLFPLTLATVPEIDKRASRGTRTSRLDLRLCHPFAGRAFANNEPRLSLMPINNFHCQNMYYAFTIYISASRTTVIPLSIKFK